MTRADPSHIGERMRVVECGSSRARDRQQHRGQIGVVVEASHSTELPYLLVRLADGTHCMATRVDEPGREVES